MIRGDLYETEADHAACKENQEEGDEPAAAAVWSHDGRGIDSSGIRNFDRSTRTSRISTFQRPGRPGRDRVVHLECRAGLRDRGRVSRGAGFRSSWADSMRRRCPKKRSGMRMPCLVGEAENAWGKVLDDLKRGAMKGHLPDRTLSTHEGPAPAPPGPAAEDHVVHCHPDGPDDAGLPVPVRVLLRFRVLGPYLPDQAGRRGDRGDQGGWTRRST